MYWNLFDFLCVIVVAFIETLRRVLRNEKYNILLLIHKNYIEIAPYHT